MKKLVAFFIAFACMIPSVSWSAVNVKKAGVKKAAPVATKQADKMESVTSLLPTVVGLVSSVRALNQQQQKLSADCVPTSSEIQLVNDLVKEWAKTGATTASVARGKSVACVDELASSSRFKCGGSGNSEGGAPNESGFENYINLHDDMCIETFSNKNACNTIWNGFPKASSGKKCDIADDKKCETVSNIYDVFALIPFGDDDYTKTEAAKISQLKAKMEKCAPGKLNAAKVELYGGFVTQTLGSLGQTSGAAGTASVLEAVSSMGGSGNIQSVLPSLGTMATQLFDK